MIIRMRRTLGGLLLSAAAMFCCFEAVLHADEGTTPASTDSLDDDLFRKLTGDEAGESADRPLEKAIRGMRDAQRRLADRQTGDDTREIQQTVVEALDELIELAQQAPPPPQGRSNSTSPDSGSEQPQGAEPENPETPSGSETGGDPEAGPRNQDDKARDSSATTDKLEDREAELVEDRRRLLEEVWGHLPPALRQRLLNVDDGKSLPKYRDLIGRYFEALADRRVKDGSR